MSESEVAVERYNRRELWQDVANHLQIAEECIGQALSALEDIGPSAIGVMPLLESLPAIEARIECYRRVAAEEVIAP